MSTPRTRHQNRSPSSPSAPQNPGLGLKKPITLIIITAAALSVGSHFFNKTYPGVLPKGTIGLIILLAFVSIILTVVLKIKKQYRMLRQSYHNLEQSMQNAMYQNATHVVDYVEYPVNPTPNYNNQYPRQYQQQYPMQYPQQYQQQYQQNNRTSTRLSKGAKRAVLSICMFMVIPLIFVDIISARSAINYIGITKTHDLISSTVQLVDQTESIRYDEDGDEYTEISYRVFVDYDYKGKHYSDSLTMNSPVYVGDTLDIYVNPDNPWETTLPRDIGTGIFVMIIVNIMFLPILIIIIIIIKRSGTPH